MKLITNLEESSREERPPIGGNQRARETWPGTLLSFFDLALRSLDRVPSLHPVLFEAGSQSFGGVVRLHGEGEEVNFDERVQSRESTHR